MQTPYSSVRRMSPYDGVSRTREIDMSNDVFRRCGCRDTDGKQLGKSCPELKDDPKHGTWSYSSSAGSNSRTGKRQQLRKSGFTTKRDAQAALNTARTNAAKGLGSGDANITIAKFLTGWLERKEQDGLRTSTLTMYRSYVDNEIIPALGRMKLADLRRHHVDEFVRSLGSDERGPTTVRRMHATLRSAMSTAVQLSLIDSNPASNVKMPAAKKFRASMWEPEEAARFLAIAAPFRLGPLFETAVHTGLRRGELCGLRWADVSFADRELVVRVQLSAVNGKTVEGDIKTNSGQDRRVSLDDSLLNTLSAWKLTQDVEREKWSSAYEDSGRVFTYENGRQLRPQWVSQVFDRVVREADLTKIRLHDLRHLHASLLIAGGVPLAIVSKRLGHSTIAITADLYGHLLRDANREAAEAAAGMLLPKTTPAHTLPTQSL